MFVQTSGHMCRPVLRVRKPWQFAALGITFWVAIMLADLDFSLEGFAAVGSQADDNLHTDASPDLQSDAKLRGVCKARQAQIGLVLTQLWAYALVFLLSSINSACALSAAFRRSWDMEMAHLHSFKCDPA